MKALAVQVIRVSLQIGALIAAIWCLLLIDTCAREGRVRPEVPENRYRAWSRAMDRRPTVRVLLRELDGSRVVTFHSTPPMRLRSGDAAEGADRRVRGRIRIRRRSTANGLVVNGRETGDTSLRLTSSKKGGTRVGNRSYRGSFHVFYRSDGGLRVVNHVPMNRYLWSVLGDEMDLSFPIEALRAQAIAARTYALWEMGFQQSENQAARYDVRNTVASQVYEGVEKEGDASRKAVRSTRGLVLIYQNRVLHAYFHSTCGGRTEHAAEAIGVEERPLPPPLQGGVACKWDDVSPMHRWTFELTSDRLRQTFAEVDAPVRRLTVGDSTSTGRARNVRIIMREGGTVTLSVEQFSGAFPGREGIASNWFRVERRSQGTFRLNGRGWGHGAGMCQMGAVGAAREGIPFEDILYYYYPDSTLVFGYGTE